jgi:hypothetical protein
MFRKRMRLTALCCLAGMGIVVGQWLTQTPVRADVVTEISTLSQANRLSLFHDYSIDSLGLSTGSIPGSAGSGLLNPLLGNDASTEPSESDRTYDISVTPLAGYDSNPEARRVAKGSAFGGVDLAADYHVNVGPYDPTVGSPTQVRLTYDVTAAAYEGTTFKADTIQQTVSGSYRRSLFHDQLFVGVQLEDQFTMEHGEALLNTFDGIPSVEWFLTPQASVEANYDYTRMGYLIRITNRRNPEADRHTANVKFHFYSFPQQRGDIPESPDQLSDILRATLRRATIGYAFIDNEATGRDYVYNANRVSIGLDGIQIPRFRNVTIDASYAHEWDNYMDPSTEGPIILAGKPKQTRRKDHVDVFTLRANSRLLDLPENRGTLATFVQWDLIADRSTIEARHFNEFIISGGLTYQW